MVVLAVGLVLYVQWNTSRKIMSDLAGRLVVRNLEVVSQGIKGHLDPVLEQVEYVADPIEGGVCDLDARARLGDLSLGSVAATPQSGGMVILDRAGLAVRVRSAGQGGRYELTFPDLGGVATFRAALNEAQARKSVYCGELFYNPQIRTTFINYRRPLRKDGRFVGLIAATATIKGSSRLAGELGDIFGNTTFLLHGNHWVLAHPRLATDPLPRSASKPAIAFERLGDPVISRLDEAVPTGITKLASGGLRDWTSSRSTGRSILSFAKHCDSTAKLLWSSAFTAPRRRWTRRSGCSISRDWSGWPF